MIDESDQKKENHEKATSSREECHECNQPGYSIGNCLIYQADQREYVKTTEGKNKEGNQVLLKINRREAFFMLVKKDLASWENSSNDAFMAKSDEVDVDKKVTQSYFKQNFNAFSTS